MMEMTGKEALQIVLELAEGNAIPNEEIESRELAYEYVRQQLAFGTAQRIINQLDKCNE